MLRLVKGFTRRKNRVAETPPTSADLKRPGKTPKTVLIVCQSHTIRFIFSLNKSFAKRWNQRHPKNLVFMRFFSIGICTELTHNFRGCFQPDCSESSDILLSVSTALYRSAMAFASSFAEICTTSLDEPGRFQPFS